VHSLGPSATGVQPATDAKARAAAEKDARFRRLERRWQDDVGQHLLDTPHQTPGSAAVFERQFQRVIDLLDLERPGFVVEVGCGKGHFLSQLQRQLGKRGPVPVGVDVSGAVTALPDKTLIGVQADGEALPFRGGSLSAVVYHGSLHHVIDYPKAIGEAHRALAPGGRLLIFEPVSTRFSRLVHAILDPLGFEEYESPIDLEYKSGFRTERILAAIRDLDMPHTVSWSDFVAYPLTGCYGGASLGRFSGLMRLLLRFEAWGERIPGVRRILATVAWRILVVATKPEALHPGDR
jgi:SAM-dependent methyltransferase